MDTSHCALELPLAWGSRCYPKITFTDYRATGELRMAGTPGDHPIPSQPALEQAAAAPAGCPVHPTGHWGPSPCFNPKITSYFKAACHGLLVTWIKLMAASPYGSHDLLLLLVCGKDSITAGDRRKFKFFCILNKQGREALVSHVSIREQMRKKHKKNLEHTSGNPRR